MSYEYRYKVERTHRLWTLSTQAFTCRDLKLICHIHRELHDSDWLRFTVR